MISEEARSGFGSFRLRVGEIEPGTAAGTVTIIQNLWTKGFRSSVSTTGIRNLASLGGARRPPVPGYSQQ